MIQAFHRKCVSGQSVKWILHTFESKCFYERNRSLKMFVFIVHTFKLDRFHQSVNLFKTSLLTVLYFDDFKFVYQIGGTMNFIILNVQTRKLFSTLFSCFPLSVRKNLIAFIIFILKSSIFTEK